MTGVVVTGSSCRISRRFTGPELWFKEPETAFGEGEGDDTGTGAVVVEVESGPE